VSVAVVGREADNKAIRFVNIKVGDVNRSHISFVAVAPAFDIYECPVKAFVVADSRGFA
jgi:hypothetical protein